MFAELLLATGIALILYAFYKWLTQKNDFFEKRGIKEMSSSFMLSAFIFRTMDATTFAQKIYGAFPNER